MFTCTTQGPQDRPVLKLEGSLTLEHAREIQAALVARLAEPTPFTIDLRGAERFDLSFIQMLHALLQDQTRPIGVKPLPQGLVELAATLGATNLIKELTTRTEESL